jgi:hypothetical protein
VTGRTPQTDRRRAMLDQLRRLVAEAERMAAQLEAEIAAEQLARRANRTHLTVVE